MNYNININLKLIRTKKKLKMIKILMSLINTVNIMKKIINILLN